MKSKIISDFLHRYLAGVSKPGRYIGNEINSIIKDHKSVLFKIVLAFPDVYEIAFPYPGFQILYHIINKYGDYAAERVYAPWVDMEALMRREKIPLFSLETKTPIKNFDAVGFTFQYELHTANILNMIDLSGMSPLRRERREEDPLVIAGGPNAFNPEPMADFIDFFVIGDAEELLIEIIKLITDSKENRLSRKELLLRLSKLDGIYVPEFYEPVFNVLKIQTGVRKLSKEVPDKIRASVVKKLDTAFYSSAPLVPLIDVSHNRYSAEVMRGCTKGCRFCGAGFIYRPVRERDPEDVFEQSRKVIENTGYGKASFVSLSTSDYSGIHRLLAKFETAFQEKQVSVSLPSMRADSFTEEIAEFLSRKKKSGLTFAPEAGSERLRKVINKDIPLEQIYRAVEIAVDKGWKLIKLYFMIGLPTETYDDLEDIVSMIYDILALGKKNRNFSLNVSISPFSPKPFTPFQWEAQNSIEEFEDKIHFIKDRIRNRRINFRWRDPRVSSLETVIGRGDRRLGSVIYTAWKAGARFDPWTDYFNYDLWMTAFKESGINPENYSGYQSSGRFLPWSIIDKGFSDGFLLSEREKAFRGEVTGDCRTEPCNVCGVCQNLDAEMNLTIPGSTIPSEKKEKEEEEDGFVNQYRLLYWKDGFARFLSHRDTITLFERALRRASVSMVYTKGFNPHPKMIFGPPLPTGYVSNGEYLDIFIKGSCDLKTKRNEINRYLPDGIEIANVTFNPQIPLSKTVRSEYEIFFYKRDNKDVTMKDIMHMDELTVFIERNGKRKIVDALPYIQRIKKDKSRNVYHLALRHKNGMTMKPDKIIRALLDIGEDFFLDILIKRTGIWLEDRTGKLVLPMRTK